MEIEIAEGWPCFYAKELWMRDHLPPPLINELGRAYMVEQLKQHIEIRFDDAFLHDPAGILRELSKRPDLPRIYRNHLEVGELTVAHEFHAAPLDLEADAIASLLLEVEHRHVEFEINRNQFNWYVEACTKCTLTPPLLLLTKENLPAVRDQTKPLAYDNTYWWRRYEPEHSIPMDADLNGMLKPSVNIALMAELAPDFPYSEALSTSKRLVFVQKGDGPMAWALIIGKDGSEVFKYPPRLVLLDRSSKKKLKNAHVLFQNVIGKRYFTQALMAQAAMELELLFHLPRSRRLIEIYRPYVEQALVEAST